MEWGGDFHEENIPYCFNLEAIFGYLPQSDQYVIHYTDF